MVEPFYANHGCANLVMDEYRKRIRDPKPISLRRYSNLYFSAYVPLPSRDGYEYEIHEYNQETNKFSKIKSVPFGIRNIDFSLFIGGKIFAFGMECEGQVEVVSHM